MMLPAGTASSIGCAFDAMEQFSRADGGDKYLWGRKRPQKSAHIELTPLLGNQNRRVENQSHAGFSGGKLRRATSKSSTRELASCGGSRSIFSSAQRVPYWRARDRAPDSACDRFVFTKENGDLPFALHQVEELQKIFGGLGHQNGVLIHGKQLNPEMPGWQSDADSSPGIKPNCRKIGGQIGRAHV